MSIHAIVRIKQVVSPSQQIHIGYVQHVDSKQYHGALLSHQYTNTVVKMTVKVQMTRKITTFLSAFFIFPSSS